MHVVAISNINEQGIQYQWYVKKGKDRKEGSIRWDDIYAADAFKRDLLTVDLICLQLTKENQDDGIEVDEEDPKWKELMIELPKRIIGFRNLESWFSEVAFPAFETNLVRVYEKNNNPQQSASHNAGKPAS